MGAARNGPPPIFSAAAESAFWFHRACNPVNMADMHFKFSGRVWCRAAVAAALVTLFFVLTYQPLPQGMDYAGETRAEKVRMLVDEAWVDEEGIRHVSQQIFDSVFEVIDAAEDYILLDFFLVNDFLYAPGPGMRPLSREITERLLTKRATHPDVQIIFITDPVNTVYGSVASAQFESLQDAGVNVVWTELDHLPDSNFIYSKLWRLIVRPWGLAPGNVLPNPMGDGRVSMRSMLKLLNFKANHRKLIVTEKSLIVTSANPHSASSAHWNVGLRIDGAGQELAFEAEKPILRFSDAEAVLPDAGREKAMQPDAGKAAAPPLRYGVELLTERKIKEKAIALLDQVEPEGRVELGMFYLSDRDLITALCDARKRGCRVRVILDPNKDAFGRTKNGIPNRQTAYRLVKAGIPVRWADTHGEQFHVKMLYLERPDGTAAVLLGSGNFTRRNMDNFNAECSVACTASADDTVMVHARDAFERWWSNPAGRVYTTEYSTYADPSLLRRSRAWWMEVTGLSSF